jgi:hypothetical protein
MHIHQLQMTLPVRGAPDSQKTNQIHPDDFGILPPIEE